LKWNPIIIAAKLQMKKIKQSLDEYEAIETNLEVVKNEERNPWVHRKLFVLRELIRKS